MGTVSATTLPPLALAASPARNLIRFSGKDRAVTFITFQLRGLRAAADMSAINSMAQSSNGPRLGMNSNDVPSKSASTEHRPTSSSRVP